MRMEMIGWKRLGILVLGVMVSSCGTAPRHPDAKNNVDACNTALNQMEFLAPDRREEALMSACGSLFVDEKCRAAMGEVAPSMSASHWYQACFEGYCDKLPESPSLCKDRRADTNPMTETVRKEEFFEKALYLDLGRDAFSRLDRRWIVLLSGTGFQGAVRPIVALPPTVRNEEPADAVDLYLVWEGEQTKLSIPGVSEERWDIPMAPAAENLKALTTALQALPALDAVNLIADPGIPYGDVVWMIDLLVSLAPEVRITFVAVR